MADVLVAVNGGAQLLLKNQAATENHWLGVRLIGKKANPDAVGAKITWQAGDVKRSRLKTGGGSYVLLHKSRAKYWALASALKSISLRFGGLSSAVALRHSPTFPSISTSP